MTSTSSLHFGPEWMRKPSRGSLTSLSPNPVANSPSIASNVLPTPPAQSAPALPNVTSYSSLLTASSPPPEIRSEDESYPFRYSKDQMIRVWKDGGGRGGLGLEVERWPGIVREVGGEPVSVREMTQEERKLFSTSVNSEPPTMRRNNSSISLAPERHPTKFGQGIGIGLGPASPRGVGTPRRRGTGTVDDPAPVPFSQRKLSVSSGFIGGNLGNGMQGSLGPMPSPSARTRVSTLDGSDSADPWSRGSVAGATTDPGWSVMGARRRESTGRTLGGTAGTPGVGLGIGRGVSFGGLVDGTASGNGDGHDKNSLLTSPGPSPVSNPEALAPAPGDHSGLPHGPNDARITNGEQHAPAANTIYATNGPPEPVVEDLANVQWSYKDPTGQIQGPFIGATMQQWFEGGYFNDDLLIKRTTIDSDFEPLRDVRRRALPMRPGEQHPQIFLSQLAPRMPPNLPPPQHHPFGTTSPLNPSPRLAHLMTGVGDPTNRGPLSAGVGGSPLAHSPATSAAVRSTTLDSYLNPSQSSVDGLVAGSIGGTALTNAALERKKREEFIQSLREREIAMGVGLGTPSQQALGTSGPFGGGFVPNHLAHHPQHSVFGPGSPGVSSAYGSQFMPPPAPIHAPVNNSTLNVVSPFPHNKPILWSTPGDEQTGTPESFNGTPPDAFDHGTIYQSTHGSIHPQSGATLDHFAQQQSTWGSTPLPPAVEAAVNITDEPTQAPLAGSIVHESPVSAQPLLPEGPDNKAVERVTAALEQATIAPEPRQPVPEPNVTVGTLAPLASTETSTFLNKRRDTINKGAGVSATMIAAAPKETASSASPPVLHTKAWATNDDDRATSLSLREIQEAEARKSEARRAAEKAAKAVSTPSVGNDESVQGVAGSWGLPQVGRASTVPVATSATNGGPAWTKPAAASTGKKSMKEIQEEEEKRKKKVTAAKETPPAATAQTASKRAYAESAKNINVPPASTGGAWTMVGAKSSGQPAAVRQPSSQLGMSTTRVVSSGGVVGSSRPSSSAGSTTQASAKPAKPAPAPSVQDETPVAPSLDFLKWLKDALKGLNGVNVEEFMQMLLSFPLDPSPAVIEIISDSIYANSSTLDGRRFAAEYCQKRKLDAAAARTAVNGGPGAKAVARASVADVVKTQPKSVQSDWGFKTVQKKKGGRK